MSGLYKCVVCQRVSTDVVCAHCLVGQSTTQGWYCYGCGAAKENAKPGTPCPAGCGHLATASWRVTMRGCVGEEQTAGAELDEPSWHVVLQRALRQHALDIQLLLGTIALAVALRNKIKERS